MTSSPSHLPGNSFYGKTLQNCGRNLFLFSSGDLTLGSWWCDNEPLNAERFVCAFKPQVQACNDSSTFLIFCLSCREKSTNIMCFHKVWSKTLNQASKEYSSPLRAKAFPPIATSKLNVSCLLLVFWATLLTDSFWWAWVLKCRDLTLTRAEP